jgi:hypothetical protein
MFSGIKNSEAVFELHAQGENGIKNQEKPSKIESRLQSLEDLL